MVLVPLLEDCRSLRDCTEGQRVWLKPMVCSSPPCCLGHVLMLAPGSVRSSDDALMVPWAKFPCLKLLLLLSGKPGDAELCLCGEISSPEVFTSWRKVAGITACLQKPPWPPESISCAQRQEGREGAECAALLELIPRHSICIFSFSCQIIDQSTGLNMHVRRKYSDNFSLIMLQPVTALRHNCQFH